MNVNVELLYEFSIVQSIRLTLSFELRIRPVKLAPLFKSGIITVEG